MADSSLRLNVIMGMVDRITRPVEQVTDKTEAMANQVKSSQRELDRLGNLSNDIEHFRRLKRGVGDTATEMHEAQRRVDALARQMNEAGAPSRALTRDFNRAKREVDQLRQSHDRENRELEETRRRLHEAGVSTRDLNGATRRIREETQRYTQDLEQQQSALDDVARQQQNLADVQERNRNLRAGALVDTAKVGAGIFAVTRFTNAYGELATAQGEIASLGVGSEGIAAITQAAEEFSSQWAGTTAPDFVRASYDIKSGISSLSDAAVGEFTRIAALTGVATKSTTDQMTSLFATGYGIYRQQFDAFGAEVIEGWEQLSAEERDMRFGEYFSAGIASAVQAFKTDGAEMSAAIESLGAAATSANVPFEEQLAILGTLQRTMSGSESATKYAAFIQSAAGAGEDLGLSFTDANNQLLSTPEILDQLRSRYGETIDAIEAAELKSAFGTDEAVDMITLLFGGVDELREGIDGMNRSLQEGTSIADAMAQAMNGGPNEATAMMMQRVQNATAALGQAFAPTVIAVSGALGEAAMVMTDLVQRFPILGQVIAFATAGLLGLMTASILGRFAFAGLSDAWIFGRRVLRLLTLSALRHNAALAVSRVRALAAGAAALTMAAGQRTMAAGMAIVTAAQWAWNAAMLANPLALIIAGIVALIAVVALVYRYWEPLAAFFTGLWGSIQEAFASGVDMATSLLEGGWAILRGILTFSPLSLLAPLWEPLGSFFGGVWDAITLPWVAGWELLTGWLGFDPLAPLLEAWGPLVDFFAGLWDRVMGVFGQALDWISGAILDPINGVREALGSVWNSLFGDDEAGVEVTQRVNQVSASTPPDLRGEAPSPDAGGGAGASGFLGASVGSVAAQGGGVTHIDQSDRRTEIHVTQQPGQSAEDVGREIDRRLDARDRAEQRRNRSRLSD